MPWRGAGDCRRSITARRVGRSAGVFLRRALRMKPKRRRARPTRKSVAAIPCRAIAASTPTRLRSYSRQRREGGRPAAREAALKATCWQRPRSTRSRRSAPASGRSCISSKRPGLGPRRLRRQQENKRTPKLQPSSSRGARPFALAARTWCRPTSAASWSYRHVGRETSSVRTQIINRAEYLVDLVYVVTEGAKKTVPRQITSWAIAFSANGNARRVPKDLRANGALSDRRRQSTTTTPSGRIARQLRHITGERDYADAKRDFGQVELRPQSNGIHAEVSIDEGPGYQFGRNTIVCMDGPV